MKPDVFATVVTPDAGHARRQDPGHDAPGARRPVRRPALRARRRAPRRPRRPHDPRPRGSGAHVLGAGALDHPHRRRGLRRHRRAEFVSGGGVSRLGRDVDRDRPAAEGDDGQHAHGRRARAGRRQLRGRAVPARAEGRARRDVGRPGLVPRGVHAQPQRHGAPARAARARAHRHAAGRLARPAAGHRVRARTS